MWIGGWKSAKFPRKVQPPTGKQSYTSINQLPAVDWDIQPHQLPTKSKKKHPTIYRISSKNSWTSIKKNIPPKVIPTESSSWWNLNRRRLGQNGIHSIGKSGDLRSQQSMNGCPPCCWSISWQQFVNVKKTWKQNKTKRDFINVRVL